MNLITKQFVVIKTFWKIETMMLTYSQPITMWQKKKKEKGKKKGINKKALNLIMF